MAVSTPTTSSFSSLPHSSYLLPRTPSCFLPFPPKALHFRYHLSSLSSEPLSLSSSASSSSSPLCRVSTAPLEQASAPGFDFEEEIARLHSLSLHLRKANTLRDKLRVLDAEDRVRDFFGSGQDLSSLDMKDEFLIKCLVSAGQEHVLGSELHRGRGGVGHHGLRKAFFMLADMIERWNLDGVGVEVEDDGIRSGGMRKPLEKLLKTLNDVEEFYDCVGGIIGYQVLVLELLLPLTSKEKSNWFSRLNLSLKCQLQEFHFPSGVNLLENAEYASQAVFWGLEGLPKLGEIYPLGGAGDRLGVVDPITGECLPAALLPYCGRTLLEGLIRDLQAREFLHFKVFGKQCITPVAIMTSSVKNNHEHILSLLEKHGWFGRGRQKFNLFEQPLVPVVATEDGQWLINEPLSLVCKPGGHGAIWKLAYDKGIFQWFYSHGRKGATVRQVSNVVAATDVTLLALAGVGLRHEKKLGFASCQRNFGATEGINVLVEKQNEDGQWTYGLTCIEYTEFEKYDIKDVPVSLNSLQAGFPANTNILYVDLRAAEEVGSSKSRSCLPGMVLNIKKPVTYVDHLGIQHSVSGGRIECTMQTIADNFLNTYASQRNKGIEGSLDTFILYNERKRVTSSTKRKRKIADTSLHQIADNSKYLHSGPPFIILLNPALGPLWEVTRQKFFGGSISEGSELQVEVAEFLWRDVQLNGSFLIIAENVMGSIRNEHGELILHYGHRCGRCKLENVKVLNRGVDWLSPKNVYWSLDIKRFEMLKVLLHGNAEFEATNVVLEGNHVFEVQDGYRMRVSSSDAGFEVKLELIKDEMMDTGSWFWEYKINGSHIQLQKVELLAL
ncbi:UTP--glucose-1-phosphate uridylyltransferase 3, chloroplastic isoform X2 [Phalaenopsis equestris]|uniref:UTP--glucose-1-phosphate uridylyltransferase 3, chloroplastic isoform X2 n=1 Tax=Phalaenopsis equestris TaxID=78828 RepID=UPI0009E50AEB|nr:UTP--glucose-1-phosphate uridylyltransferase 3, chloroplastic isoform X2 [Phalaenopsis equestris]